MNKAHPDRHTVGISRREALKEISPEVKEWAAGNDVLLRQDEITEWVCFLIESDHPVLALRLIRQAYRCNPEDAELIKDAMTRGSPKPGQYEAESLEYRK